MFPALLVLAALSFSAAPQSVDEQRRKDMICLVLFSSLVDEGEQKGDTEQARHAAAAARYFFDRLVGRDPNLDVGRAMMGLASEIGNNR